MAKYILRALDPRTFVIGLFEGDIIIMKGISSIAIAVSVLSAYTDALVLQKRTAVPKVVGFPMQRKPVANPLARDRLRRRSETIQANLDNEVSFGW